jgi:hypothetical protein
MFLDIQLALISIILWMVADIRISSGVLSMR